MRRGETRRNQLFDDVKDKRAYGKFNLKALHCTQWRTRFVDGYLTRHETDYHMNE
jgi:hypothetical protein